MKLLSVVGKEENINSFIINYLLESGLQPENAIKVFEKGWNLSYFTYDNTARELQKEFQELAKKLNVPDRNIEEDIGLKHSLEEIKEDLEHRKERFRQIELELQEKEKRIVEIENQKKILQYWKGFHIRLEDLYNLRYMRFRYGKVSKENYEKVVNELEDIDAIVLKLGEEEETVWLLYFTTVNYSKQADSFFNIAKFERVWIDKELIGEPIETIKKLENEQEELTKQIKELESQKAEKKAEFEKDLPMLEQEVELYLKINTVKRYMAHDTKGNFYVVGWLPLSNLEKMIPELEKDDIDYVVKAHDEVASTPPTHLKNNRLFKPFEVLVEMYGLPNYTELDPTAFVAITAFLMFGFMFGDVGQGLVILLFGLFLKRKKVALGPVFCFGGISSMIFGLLYGSVFGKEDIIPKLLISPMDNIQTMLMAGIGVGAVLIIIAMALNVVNAIKNKDKAKIFFDSNGIAGIVFYVTVLVAIVGFAVNGQWPISAGIMAVLIVLPLVLIFFKEPLTKWIDKKKQVEKSSFVEKFFEMFEMLLSFVSNTISFVRLAAFAINHVGLCMAIYILADMVGGSGNLIVGIIGNGIVIVLEGLIVAIQVLRLEYYELFSRFYTGDGKEYKPINVKK